MAISTHGVATLIIYTLPAGQRKGEYHKRSRRAHRMLAAPLDPLVPALTESVEMVAARSDGHAYGSSSGGTTSTVAYGFTTSAGISHSR
jgi:enterochelin esterase-like enzyme